MKPKTLTIITGVAVVLAATAYLAWELFTPSTVQVATTPAGYSGQPTLGNPAAPVKVILFENFLCEHCKAFEEEVFPRLKRDYIDTGQAEAYYINLAWGPEEATTVALAGECAYQQDEGAFWEYKSLLFQAQGSAGWATPESLTTLAGQVPNLDSEDLRECIAEDRYLTEVQRDLEIAEVVGVQATPSVVIGNQGFQGPGFSTLSAEIERQLEQVP